MAAHDAYEHAKAEQHEEALAAREGDYAKAEEHGVNAGYDLHRVEDLGGASAHPTIEALEDKQDHSVQALGYARAKYETAHAYAVDASANADTGHVDAAAHCGATAEAHHDSADAHASDAGHSADTTSPAAAEPAAAAETSGETTE